MSQSQTLGVLGGLGPMATAYFMELVTDMTDAAVDQQHLNMIVFSTPDVPDRTAYILDNTCENPLPYMVGTGRKLAELGVCQIAIPCITAHYFWDDLSSQISAPVLNAVEETVSELDANGIRRAGILATNGTVQAEIFHKALRRRGIEPIVPDEKGQADVMHLIYDNIKAGKQPDMDRFYSLRQSLFAAGAQAIILGCTELSMIKRDYPLGPGFIDVMEVLAQRSVLACGKPLKETYNQLITG